MVPLGKGNTDRLMGNRDNRGKKQEQAKLSLPQVTLAAMTSVKLYETVKALEYSMRGISFGQVVLISHRKPFFLPKGITFQHTSRLTEIDHFNYKIVYELHEYIKTPYVLLVHYDGFVVHPENWREEFLQYDYIGSPWPIPKESHCYQDIHGNLCRVGNSVSLRSKRLLAFPAQAGIPWEPSSEGSYNEDIFLCCMNKHLIEGAGMKIAPVEAAKYFGHEHPVPETVGITPFLFHKWWGNNKQYPRFENPVMATWEKGKTILRKTPIWKLLRRCRKRLLKLN